MFKNNNLSIYLHFYYIPSAISAPKLLFYHPTKKKNFICAPFTMKNTKFCYKISSFNK